MHAGTAAGGADDDQWELFHRGPLGEPGEAFADHASHAAHDERRVGDADGDPAGANHARAGEGGIGKAGPLLFGDEPLGVGPLVAETERVGGPQVGVPLLERAGVEQLLDPLGRRDIPVEAALRTDVEELFGLLAVDRGLAAVAFQPEALGHAALNPGCGLGRAVGIGAGRNDGGAGCRVGCRGAFHRIFLRWRQFSPRAPTAAAPFQRPKFTGGVFPGPVWLSIVRPAGFPRPPTARHRATRDRRSTHRPPASG